MSPDKQLSCTDCCGTAGQARAAAVTALLQELNDAVAGSYVDEAPEALLLANPRFLDGFALVIATQARAALGTLCRLLVLGHGKQPDDPHMPKLVCSWSRTFAGVPLRARRSPPVC